MSSFGFLLGIDIVEMYICYHAIRCQWQSFASLKIGDKMWHLRASFIDIVVLTLKGTHANFYAYFHCSPSMNSS